MEDNKKLKEKIELNFHTDDILELIILNMVNNCTFTRNREYFIKDILLKYFKENNNKEFNELEKNIKSNMKSKETIKRMLCR